MVEAQFNHINFNVFYTLHHIFSRVGSSLHIDLSCEAGKFPTPPRLRALGLNKAII